MVFFFSAQPSVLWRGNEFLCTSRLDACLRSPGYRFRAGFWSPSVCFPWFLLCRVLAPGCFSRPPIPSFTHLPFSYLTLFPVCLSICLPVCRYFFFSLFSPCCPHRCRRDPCQGLREDAALGVALHDGQPEACRFVSLSSAAYPRCLELNYVGIYFEYFSNIRMCFLCVTGALSSFIALTSLVVRFRVKHGTDYKFSSL